MPTFLLIRSGEVVDQFSGANAAVLRQKIESLLEGGCDASKSGNDEGAEETTGNDAVEGTE